MNQDKKPLSFGRKLLRGLLFMLLGTVIGLGIGFAIVVGVTNRHAVKEPAAETVRVADNGYSGNSTQKFLPAVTMDARTRETAADVQRSVVTIMTRVVVASPFGDQEGAAIGSGVIYSKDEDTVYVVTNAHVLSDAKEIFLYFGSEDKTPAQVQGEDPEADLAVLKVEADKLSKASYADIQPAQWGNSDQVRAGDICMAVGCPYGMEYDDSVTLGIIGGTEREISYDGRTVTVMQTDAAINPGNSGGAMADIEGRVIGINSAKIQMESVEGMGFFIPINTVLPIVETLIKDGSIERPILGIASYDFISETMAEIYDVPVGLVVYEVGLGRAAASGLQAGDIITAIDGKTLTALGDVDEILRQHAVGDVVELTVVRGRGNRDSFTLFLTLSGSQSLDDEEGSFFNRD